MNKLIQLLDGNKTFLAAIILAFITIAETKGWLATAGFDTTTVSAVKTMLVTSIVITFREVFEKKPVLVPGK